MLQLKHCGPFSVIKLNLFQFIQNNYITPHHFILLVYSWINKSLTIQWEQRFPYKWIQLWSLTTLKAYGSSESCMRSQGNLVWNVNANIITFSDCDVSKVIFGEVNEYWEWSWLLGSLSQTSPEGLMKDSNI